MKEPKIYTNFIPNKRDKWLLMLYGTLFHGKAKEAAAISLEDIKARSIVEEIMRDENYDD